MNARVALDLQAIQPVSSATAETAHAPRALPEAGQFGALVTLIKSVFQVPAVAIALHGEPDNAETGSYRTFLEMPLVKGDEVIGSLRILDNHHRTFTDHDCALLEGFARLVVEQVSLWAEASRDMLTGAMTRRAFLDILRKNHAARQRQSASASLVIVDLDHFKAINDSWGHAAGDAVLKATARTVMRALRAEDYFGRLGGEEFAILVAHADAQGAADVAERVRAAIESTKVPGYPQIKVTASFGVAELTDTMLDADDWVEAADDQLYRAKEEGRNRVARAVTVRRPAMLN